MPTDLFTCLLGALFTLLSHPVPPSLERPLSPAVSTGVALSVQGSDTDARQVSPDKSPSALEALGAQFIGAAHNDSEGDHVVLSATRELTTAGRQAVIDRDRRLKAEVRALDWNALNAEEKVDATILGRAIDYQVWELTVERPWQRDVVGANQEMSSFLSSLANDERRQWPERMLEATVRMEELPGYLEQVHRSIVPALVPANRAQLVAEQSAHLGDGLTDPFDQHRDVLPAAERARYDRARLAFMQAINMHQRWIASVLVPNARGDARLGPALYDQKLSFELGSDLKRADIEQRARAEAVNLRARMYAIAVNALKGRNHIAKLPAIPTDAEQQAAIREALGLAYAQTVPSDGFMAAARTAVDDARAFVIARHLVAVPGGPVRLGPMPAYLAGVVPAFCSQENGVPMVAIASIPPEWDEAHVKAYLGENNRYAIADLLIHEGMPGHYLQLSHAQAGMSTIRSALPSGVYAEGWAVYAEGMMLDAGYQDSDPLFALTVLKVRLRAVTSALLDIGVHAEHMDEAEGIALLTHDAFLSQNEALSRYRRSTLQPTQLLRYFVGYTELMSLRAEAQARQGHDFDLYRFNNEVLAHGAPPVPLLRALLLGSPMKPDGPL